MKKFLSVLLSALMLVLPLCETAVFAAPSAVSVIDTAVEAPIVDAVEEEETLLAADITYTVSFNANGGSGAPLSQKKLKGKNLVLKDTMPVRDGYTFVGWSTSKDASVAEYVPDGNFSLNKSVTLYAVWSDEFDGMESVGVQYRVVATPYSHISDEEPTYTTGYDCLLLEKIGGTANSVVAPVYVYVTPEDLGIDGENLDDYILSVFSVVAVIEEYNNIAKIHTILACQNNMSKKTVTELELCEVDSNNETSYFYDDDYNLTQAKLLSGRVKIGGTNEEFYVFNAPHSYASPVIEPSYNIISKYYARNAFNIRRLYEYSYYSNGNKITAFEILSVVEEPIAEQIEEEYFYDQAYQLAEMFSSVYYGGQYEADLYDVDGDGLYDYIDYKPYAFFRVDADEDEYFEDSDFFAYEDDNVFPYIYTNGATVIGEDFNNGDYVIGYFSMDSETVKIADVVEPTVDLLAGYRISAGTLTLGNGDTVSVTGAYKLLANMYPVSEYGDIYYGIVFDHEKQSENEIENCYMFDSDLIGKQLEFYVYDGVLLHASKVDSTLKYTGNLIIPTDLYFEYEYDGYLYNTNYNINGDEDITCYPEEAFDAEAGKMWYVFAWGIDGKAKYVPVNTEDCEPAILQNGELAPEYRDKLCTYTVDEDGVYTITSLGYDVDDYDSRIYTGINRDGLEGEYDNCDEYTGFEALNDEKDSTLQYYADSLDGEIYKIAGTRFNIGGFERYVDIKSNALIVIREFDIINQCFTYVVSDGSTFVQSPSLYENAVFTNISLIVENNPDSKSREDLLLLYAETTNTSKKPEKPKDNYKFDFPENIIIPTDLYFGYTYVDEDGEEYWYTTEEFLFGNDDEIVRFPEQSFDGELGKVWYVYAWVDGEMKYVPVNNDAFDRVIDSWGYISDEYKDKICTYTIDEDGFYVIKSIGYENLYDEELEGWIYINQDISSIDNTTDSNLLYHADNMAGSICNIVGKRYEVADFDREVVLTDESRIIIRVFDIEEQEFEYAEYDAETFFGSDRDTVFTNISFVLRNDPSSKTKENLLVLYAETTDTAYLKEKTEQEEPVYEFNFPENIIIPTDLYYEYSYYEYGDELWYSTFDMVFGNDDEIVRFPEEAFDGKAGKVWYIYAWVDGKTKYVPVKAENMSPSLIRNGELRQEYRDKICTYTIDENGLYVIKSLGYAEDGIEKEDILVLNDKNDDSIMFYSDGNAGTIEKIAGPRFSVSGFDRAVNITAETKIIIRVFDVEEQDFEYRVFDAASFKNSLDNNVELTNMSYIVRNNIDSNVRENLVVLYAETTELSFKGVKESNSERVVSDHYIGQDENGIWRFYYELYDPYTGKFVSDVPSDYGASKASNLNDDEAFEIGSIINLIDGKVDHSVKNYLGFADNNKLVYFKEVEVEDGYFSVVNYNDVACASYDGGRLECGVDCKICIRDNVEEYDGYVYDFIHDSEILNGYEEPTSYIRFDENTVVSVITKSGTFDTDKIWTGSKASLSDMSKIASKNKSLLCRNDMMMDRNGNYITGYSEYVKAYVSVVDENLDKGEIPLAKFVIVVVNENEYAALNYGCFVHDPVENEPQFTTGDLNEDDAVDVNDAILLLQHSMFPELYPIDYPGDVDFNDDGNIDMNDAILLLQHSMFPELYPIE